MMKHLITNIPPRSEDKEEEIKPKEFKMETNVENPVENKTIIFRNLIRDTHLTLFKFRK